MIALWWPYNKNKLYKILDYWSRDILNFHFPEKGLASSPHFCMIFNWPNIIIWLLLLLKILGNMRIKIVCWPGCDAIKFETNVIFLIKPFRCMTKKSRQKSKYLENEEEFLRWNKKHFSSFLKRFQLPKFVSDLRLRL